MVETRITDPSLIDRSVVAAILGCNRTPTVQFSRPGYTPYMLGQVNDLCQEFGERIEVRFYGHYASGFDASVLEYLPSVRWLSVDSLDSIANEDRIGKLPLLHRLSFGAYRFDSPSFLETLDVARLTDLSLGENANRNFDLTPLRDALNLKILLVQGHKKNIACIADIPHLETISLNGIPNRVEIDFLNDVRSLRSLTLLLGGRASFNEMHHDHVESLKVIRVRGLETLGQMSRFPRLRKLHVEDQLQLRSIEVLGAPLEEIKIINCKSLKEISDISSLDRLQHVRVSRSNMDISRMIDFSWPDSLKILALYTGKTKLDAEIRTKLDLRGFSEFGSWS